MIGKPYAEKMQVQIMRKGEQAFVQLMISKRGT